MFNLLATTTVLAAALCPFHDLGTPAPGTHGPHLVKDKDEYSDYLRNLDIGALYETIKSRLFESKTCWPADGPQDDEPANYAGLMGRLAWHCAGTLRIDGDGGAHGGCEGGNIRFWPEREWRDNGNLDQARAILAEIKDLPDYHKLSWGDLITFAGTVGIKASNGPADKFCFGRLDYEDGSSSVKLGVEGTNDCDEASEECVSHGPCPAAFHWSEQDPNDDARCAFTQKDNRYQASHSVGLIYVYPHGPQLREDHEEYNPNHVHQRSIRLSAAEVRDTFHNRMGWSDQETVALIGGGHTLGRAHGNCPNVPENVECNGEFTTTSGFEGAWTRTPSTWNYDFFDAMFDGTNWYPSKSPEGNDQWATASKKWRTTMRLTADLALVEDPAYRNWARKYNDDHNLFDNHFAKAWYKLTHRSANHPGEDDLEEDFGVCYFFGKDNPKDCSRHKKAKHCRESGLCKWSKSSKKKKCLLKKQCKK